MRILFKTLWLLLGILMICQSIVYAQGTIAAASKGIITVASSGADYTTLQAAVGAAESGTTIQVGFGEYIMSEQLNLNKAGITIVGAGQESTIIDVSGVNGYGILWTADDIEMRDLTVIGPSVDIGSAYGLKIEAPNNSSDPVRGVTLTRVTVQGSGRSEIDFNYAEDIVLTDVTTNGMGTKGVGIGMISVSNIELDGVTTLGNDWGGVGIFTNASVHFDSASPATNIEITDLDTSEDIGLYAEGIDSDDITGLNAPQFLYLVRNPDHREGGGAFTFYEKTESNGIEKSLWLNSPNSSSIQSLETGNLIVAEGMTIQAAIKVAEEGAIIEIKPGEYLEGITNVDFYGNPGTNRNFGLQIYKSGLTLRGVDELGNPITDVNNAQARITAQYQAGFGAQHFVSGSGVTIEGLVFLPYDAGTNKTFEVIGDDFTMRNSVIDNRNNNTNINFYISIDALSPELEDFTLEDNIFYSGETSGALLVIGNGVGKSTASSGRVIDNITLIGNGLSGQRGIQVQGRIPSQNWQLEEVGPVTVTNNIFTDIDIPVRSIGHLVGDLAWDDIFQNDNNTFGGNAVLTYEGNTSNARETIIDVSGADVPNIQITRTIQGSVDRAQEGDKVLIMNGAYTETVAIDHGIFLIGESRDGTIINGGIRVNGHTAPDNLVDGLSIENVTVNAGTGQIGIHTVSSIDGKYNTNDFSLANVSINTNGEHGIGLFDVDGAVFVNIAIHGDNSAFSGIEMVGLRGFTMTDSDIKNTQTGINVFDDDGYEVNDDISFSGIRFANNDYAVTNATTDLTIDASQNWWGSSKGPQHSSNAVGDGEVISDNVSYAPWYVDEDLSLLSSELGPESLDIITQPESVSAGAPIAGPPAVRVSDTFGNPVSGVDVVVSLEGDVEFDGGTLSVATDGEGLATFDDLVVNTVGTYTLVFGGEGIDEDASSDPFTITTGSGLELVIHTQPESVSAGAPIAGPPAVRVSDTFGNPVSGVDVVVSLEGDVEFDGGTLSVATDGEGLATFDDLVVNTVGTYTLVFGGEGIDEDASSDPFTITTGSGLELVIHAQPESVSAGAPIAGPPAVRVDDGFGNPVSGEVINVLLAGDGVFNSGTFSVVTDENGIGFFPDLVIRIAGEYALLFSPEGIEAGLLSDSFSITPANERAITIVTQPGTTMAGEPIQGPPTVRLADRFGNPLSGVEVSTTLLDGTEFVSGDQRQTTNKNGFAVFPNLVISDANSYVMVFHSENLESVTSESFLIDIDPVPPATPESVVATLDDIEVLINWDPPVSDGGEPITRYIVQYTSDNGTTWSTFYDESSTETAVIFTDVEYNTRYGFRVAAENAIGMGEFSAPSNSVVSVPPPPDIGGEDVPEAPPGEAVIIIGGVPVVVNTEISEDNTVQLQLAPGINLSIGAVTGSGEDPELDEEEPVLRFERGGGVKIGGGGFKAGSTVAMWLFSTPTLLGYVDVDENGFFTGDLPVPDGMDVGSHSLFIQGVAPDGAEQALALGVEVDPNPIAAGDAFFVITTWTTSEGKSTAPTLSDYNEAGITGVVEAYIETINAIIASSPVDQVDTVAEIQAIVSVTRIAGYAESDGTADAPVLADYRILDIEGVKRSYVVKINAHIALLSQQQVDTFAEILAVVEGLLPGLIADEALARIGNYVESDGTTVTPPTLEDYITAGILNVDEDNIELMNESILTYDKVDIDTVEKLQAVVDAIISTSIDESGDGIATFRLEQNYPNPFNPVTTIRYELPMASTVSIVVYNMLGQRVAVLIDGQLLPSGRHQAQWNATRMASGVYYYMITAQQNGNDIQYEAVKSMLLLK